MSADEPGPAGDLRDQLFAQFRSEAENENIANLGAGDLEALAEALWSLVADGPGDGSRVRVRTALGAGGRALQRSVLEVVGPDMPFLVDSLLHECAAHGLDVIALFHPILGDRERRRVSTIQIHLPLLSDSERSALEAGARTTLAQISRAVSDHIAMREAMQSEISELAAQPHLDAADQSEAVAFLNWLVDEHFVFLGKRTYEFPRDAAGNVLPEEPDMVEGSNLGLLRDESLNVLARTSEPAVLTPEIGAFLQRPDPLIISKSTLISRVHRRVFADYVGIKHYDEQGRVKGETRFLGLFTAEAYNEPVRAIPLVRQRVQRVLEASGAVAGGHDAKALTNLLETWPRDELFQADSETLTPILLGALHLVGRPRTRLFLRRDEFDRFVTAIVYVPRESYDTRLRQQMTAILETAFDGEVTYFEPRFEATPLTRVHFNIALKPDHPEPDPDTLEARIARQARTWDEAFRSLVASANLPEAVAEGALCFRGAFNAAYREAFTPETALDDVRALSALRPEAPVSLSASRTAGAPETSIEAKIYSRADAIPLSQCVPVFENMGLFVEFETGYPIRPGQKPSEEAPDVYWVHALSMHTSDGRPLDVAAVAETFEAAFVAVWDGRAENDGFNRLILTAGATWREAALVRALCGYRSQSGMDPARQTQIDALNAHPDLACRLLALFHARFDPSRGEELTARAATCAALRAEIETGLERVAALDDDRVIRRLADLIMVLQRTNFYQKGPDGGPRPTIAVKVASREIDLLPDPKPFREIFVASPTVEGVHCRFAPVARGGLRWSDRRDDYRTEVLGLVKAQQVKNAVIVPAGAKGGFFPKQLPQGGSREAVREAGIAAYRDYVTALIELTDNLVDGRVVHPRDTVVWDGEDPYLVVAADKGTATFSDIANEISEGQGFWLGDAFASGGSAGYDHKKMGITARGAWEAVKRHFREMGKDIQSEPFTVIGVGDMSGDVFGNGMLLSRKIRLLAAFNHLHIFIDPDPQDPDRTWEERKRLFDLPRSSWADYDTSLISKGGGVFERAAKSIQLSEEIKAMTGLARDHVTPGELIHALLRAQAELLWFGGIGTYVKAPHETNADVGDRTNDGIRVDADQLHCQVIGEGANLGMTQASRVAFALRGGRVNSDAIDNSAGVDSSDHEVNIKILTAEAMRRGDLSQGERNPLLARMTEDVARKVLAHNYAQTGTLTLARASAGNDHNAHERLMVYLEARGVLDREIEGLPDTAEMDRRHETGAPLTRPELAVLLAWSKITLFEDLVDSTLPDDPAFASTLEAYFPAALAAYPDAMQAHRLRREIIATVIANRLLDTGGPAFLQRLREATGAGNADIARGFEIAQVVLSLSEFEAEVAALDLKVSAERQTELRAEMATALARATEWFTAHDTQSPVGDVIERFQAPLDTFKATLRATASDYVGARIERHARALIRARVPESLARWAAAVGCFARGLPLVPLAARIGRPMEDVAATFYRIGDALRIDRLRDTAEEALTGIAFWDRVATRRQIDDLVALQAGVTLEALEAGGADAWLEPREARREDLLELLREIGGSQNWTFAKFALSADALRRFMTAEV